MKKYLFLSALLAVLPAASVYADFSFADVENVEFYFSSGAGAWDTQLTIQPDGHFSGNYHDSDMGDTGEGYPNGTLYFCNFSGTFTNPEKVDDYTYVFQMNDLKFENTPDTEEIIDETLYKYSEAYGLDSAEDFYMYLPGKPLDEVPEEYKSWVTTQIQESDRTLPFYGLYNEHAEEGFSAYTASQNSSIHQLIESAEEKAAELEAELDGGNLPQQQLNQTSAELFQVWDDALNEIWAYLKENLDAEAMEALTKEEQDWIARKEADMKKEGSEYEGGSMQPYIESMTAYRWTKERVYELEKQYS